MRDHLRAPELRKDLRSKGLDLLRLVGRVADRVEHEVGAAGLDKALELLSALVRRADDAVLLRERAEVLGVALREPVDPDALGALVVLAERDEGQVALRESFERAVAPTRSASMLGEASACSAPAGRRRNQPSPWRPARASAAPERPLQMGGAGLWTGLGSMLAPSNCVKRPLKLAGESRHSARTTSMPSVTRAPRSACGMPQASNSFGFSPPTPTPKMGARPSVSRST